MKKQDVFKILVAAILVLTMVFSIFAYIFTSPSSNSESQPSDQQSQQDKYNPDFWIINQPFYSISDALNMTPSGAVMADYADLEGMTPQMMQWARTNLSIISETDSIYNSSSTIVYYSNLNSGKNNSFLLLSTMSPEKNDFEYIQRPNTSIPILIRQERQYYGLYNIMGTPVILAPPQTAVDVLNIIYSQNKTNTSYDQYSGLLSNVAEPAQFQIVNSNVSFASQFYMGIGTTNGTYERTAAYLNINSSNLIRLKQLETNSTRRGFVQYNITLNGNYTIVKIASPDFFNVLNEETS